MKIIEKIIIYSIIVLSLLVVGLQYRQYVMDQLFLQSQNNKTMYMIMETQIRILHHVIPHKPYEMVKKNDGSGFNVPMCSACMKELQEIGMYDEVGQWINESRYNELLEIEKKFHETNKK